MLKNFCNSTYLRPFFEVVKWQNNDKELYFIFSSPLTQFDKIEYANICLGIVKK